MESRRENSGGGKRKRILSDTSGKKAVKKSREEREAEVSNERPESFRAAKKPGFGERPAGKKTPRSYNDTSRSAARNTDSKRPYKKREDTDTEKPARRSPARDASASKRPYKRRDDADSSERPVRKKSFDSDAPRPASKRPASTEEKPKRRDFEKDDKPKTWKKPSEFYSKPKDGTAPFKKRSAAAGSEGGSDSRRPSGKKLSDSGGLTRLNKYIANAGICSRREADELIAAGSVKVNGEIITEMGYKVKPGDKVIFGDQALRSETKRYVLLNKPKDYITTLDDPEGRKTVVSLVKNACAERIYPVGRLDRNTSGVLLLTNDGDLTKKLTHPSHNIRKVYHVVIDQPLAHEDLKQIEKGVELEDGFIKVDAIDFIEGTNRKELGIEIHSGKNRIVRRIFEHLGYTINRLDRVVFAGLTKKDLPRGHWRHLSKEEINFLKML